MTKDQKLEWLANATPEQLVNQLSSMASIMATSDLATRINTEEDFQLTRAEILKRLG